LETQRDRDALARQRIVHVAISGDAVEAGDARPVAIDLLQQMLDAGGQFRRSEIARFRRRALDEIGETDAETQQRAIVLRPEGVDAQRSARAFGQDRARDARPEAVARTREITSALGRVDRGVDADEHDIEPRGEKIG